MSFISCLLTLGSQHERSFWWNMGFDHYSPVNIGHDLKQIATELFSERMHSGEVSLKHTNKSSAPSVGEAGQILFPLVLPGLFGYQL